MLPRLANFARDTSGAVAPLFATALIGLVSAGALAWDISRGYAMKAELEAAVDAAALAGATQLDGQSDSITRATTADAGALVQNSKRMGDTYEANVVTASSGDTIQYLTDLTSRTVTTDGAQAQFIEITLAPRPMGLILGALVHTGGFNGRAHAVAGYGSALCKAPPMMVCNPDETASVKTFDPDAHIGQGIVLKSAPPGGTWAPGNFGYLSVSGPDGIPQAMGSVSPKIECFGETVTTQPGNIASADQYFNSRFDFYSGSVSSKKSDPNYLPSQNTITGRGNSCTPATPVYTQCGGANPTSMPLPRDCCAYNNGTCSGPQSGTTVLGDANWEKTKYFAVNHSGATLPSNWSTYGPNPAVGAAPTRYQVYNWENAAINAKIESGTGYPAGMFSNTANDKERSSCYTGGTVHQTTPDRRTISIIVANCKGQNMNGVANVDVVTYMDLFLTEPVVLSGVGANQRLSIYGEIIGKTTDISSVGKETRVYSVRLYE
jgi:hypothetical protein